jgi:DNA-binding response OmpR family regulator
MTLLVAESDPALIDVLGYILGREGHCIMLARDGVETMRIWKDHDPELVLLDTSLPRLNGWDICKWIRIESTTPVILLSTASREEDILRGLELGADDYISIPFGRRLLVARTHAVLRRRQRDWSDLQHRLGVLSVGDLRLDPQSRIVEQTGKLVALTEAEFRILYALVLHNGQILTNRLLQTRVWGQVEGNYSRIVKEHILSLRRKLERDPRRPLYIHTIPGVGYAFLPHQQNIRMQ